jgi:hypothetical protein
LYLYLNKSGINEFLLTFQTTSQFSWIWRHLSKLTYFAFILAQSILWSIVDMRHISRAYSLHIETFTIYISNIKILFKIQQGYLIQVLFLATYSQSVIYSLFSSSSNNSINRNMSYAPVNYQSIPLAIIMKNFEVAETFSIFLIKLESENKYCLWSLIWLKGDYFQQSQRIVLKKIWKGKNVNDTASIN